MQVWLFNTRVYYEDKLVIVLYYNVNTTSAFGSFGSQSGCSRCGCVLACFRFN